MKISVLLKIIFNKRFYKALFSLASLILWIFIFKDFFRLAFLTFIFYYLFSYFAEELTWKLKHISWKIRNSFLKKIIQKIFSYNFIVIYLYIIFIWIIFFAVYDVIPTLLKELSWLPKYLGFLWDKIDLFKNNLEQVKNFTTDFQWTVSKLMTEKNIEIIKVFLDNVKSIWSVIFDFILALILSYVFLIDKKRINKFFLWLKNGNFSFIYTDYKFFFSKITKWFWSFLKAQSMISLVDTILVIIWLNVISFVTWTSFPFIFTLAIIVFIFWFVPILWVIISSIPMLIIGFSIWWIKTAALVMLMIIIINIIETYYLNPKITSSFMEVPLFLGFCVPIVFEHFFWLVWLLVGFPILYITLNIFKDIDVYITNISKVYKRSLSQKNKKEDIV